jgi:hypothetical protein
LLVPEDPYAPANRRISIVVLRTQGEAAPSKSEARPTGEREVSPPAGAETTEKRAAKTKLATEGKVAVGEPDALPADVKRRREPASSRKD